ncbi:MAG: DUF2236 domain-containing protein [Bacteroidia bacterium]
MSSTDAQYTWKGIDLNALREVMDKPADEAVLSLYESSSMTTLRTMLEDMAKNDSVVPEELPEQMNSFMTSELACEFSDEDIRMFKKSHEIWREYGMKFCFVLFFRSLPYTYMAEKPANVLRITKLLITQPERRIFETAQFVFDVMDRNWWEPDKRGLLTAIKVRLMHSAMRHVILADAENPWDNTWGKPISQEDIVATNQTFSLEFFNGLALLGEELPQADQEAWFYTWKRIGQIMGVQDELICSNVKEAWSLQHAVYNHLFHDKCYSGILLSEALVNTLSKFMMSHRLILHMMRKMLTDELYPDCFNRMMEPTYGAEYPLLFETHTNEADQKDHEERLRADHHKELIGYYRTIKAHRDSTGKKTISLNWWQKILAFFGLLRMKRKGLLHKHVGILHEILHDGEVLVDKLEEEGIQKAMSAMGGIIISILSKYFRKGKNSGFRIPEDLQEHWELD